MSDFSLLIAEAEQAVSERLGVRRMIHVLGCAQVASALAGIYGVDPQQAVLAALLHDWDKQLPPETLKARARLVRPDLDPGDSSVFPALHSFTAAAAVRERFPAVPEEVISAIARHTVADTVMSELDCVTYIADMIEPSRHFDGVDSLREAVGNVSLEVLFLLTYKRSIIHLVTANRTLYPETSKIFNAAVRAVQE